MSYLAERPFCQCWAVVFNLQFPDFAPMPHRGGVVGVSCRSNALDRAAPDFVDPILRVVEPVGIRHRVEVIEIAKKLVKPV